MFIVTGRLHFVLEKNEDDVNGSLFRNLFALPHFQLSVCVCVFDFKLFSKRQK